MTTNQPNNPTVFHPSLFESANGDTPKDIRTLLNVKKQRENKLGDTDLTKLVSPGKFNLTDNDNISNSNTRHLFKNLYGETLLTFLFFSSDNVTNIQNLIKYIVHREVGYVIDDQNPNEMLIIMRSIFLEYSAHPPLIDKSMSDDTKQKLYTQYTKEVTRLNEIVINQVVPKVISQLQQYLDYLRDASTQPMQMEIPKSDSISGEREYRSITQVLTGSQL